MKNSFKRATVRLRTIRVLVACEKRAKSTDCDKLTTNKLNANQRFCHSDFVTDFITVISSKNVSLGEMALGIVKYFYDHRLLQLQRTANHLVHGQL